MKQLVLSHIVEIESEAERRLVDAEKVEKKTYLGFITLEEKWISTADGYTEYNKRDIEYDQSIKVENDKLYKKAYIKLHLSNGNIITKYFNSTDNMKNYLSAINQKLRNMMNID